MRQILMLAVPETVIASFFIAMTILGLSKDLADRGINPLMMEIAGVAWIVMLVVKLIFNLIGFAGRRTTCTR